MDKAAVCSTSRNTIRTDLTLLLECLKFQMKCPDLQKQALLAIHSICEKRDVKETALFTLGTLAEANVYCKNSLCRKETFVEIAKWLMKEDIPLTLKRVSVYLLSVLVSNNNEGQSICVAAFPIIKVWLEQITMPRTEIFQPICSFIAMTVANNEEHQSQLVQCGGLPVIITLLTEDTSEEVRKAATFILQTCKEATMSLTVPGLISGEDGNAGASYKLGSIQELSQRAAAQDRPANEDTGKGRTYSHTEDEDEQEDADPSASTLPPVLPLLLQKEENIKTIPTAYKQISTHMHVEAGGDNSIKSQTVKNVMNENELKNVSSDLSMQEERAATSAGDVWCSVCKGTGVLMSSRQQSLEGGREPHTADTQLFKPPAPAPKRHSVPTEIKCTDKEGLQGCKMSKAGKIPVKKHSFAHIRCAGCVMRFEEVTSRTFASLQSSCRHSCDIHKVLQEATERYRTRNCSLLFRRQHQDVTADSKRVSAAEPQRKWKNCSEVRLTPMRKGAEKDRSSKKLNAVIDITLAPLYREPKKDALTSYRKTGPSLTPLKRPIS
ncbi:Telomere repeats-binding bouquet formation protein 1 [Larimichthys crocea]|uniref:Uncharacterized protein n=1 Tax=Larimichthys crocea TaxID=215358 RepID=A0ACD3QF17_LARCR|nr:Telomere repeats-binding bouquet formation protein 1 [Larimichthys crocea]